MITFTSVFKAKNKVFKKNNDYKGISLYTCFSNHYLIFIKEPTASVRSVFTAPDNISLMTKVANGFLDLRVLQVSAAGWCGCPQYRTVLWRVNVNIAISGTSREQQGQLRDSEIELTD